MDPLIKSQLFLFDSNGLPGKLANSSLSKINALQAKWKTRNPLSGASICPSLPISDLLQPSQSLVQLVFAFGLVSQLAGDSRGDDLQRAINDLVLGIVPFIGSVATTAPDRWHPPTAVSDQMLGGG